jgi:hypothetical protein
MNHGNKFYLFCQFYRLNGIRLVNLTCNRIFSYGLTIYDRSLQFEVIVSCCNSLKCSVLKIKEKEEVNAQFKILLIAYHFPDFEAPKVRVIVSRCH